MTLPRLRIHRSFLVLAGVAGVIGCSQNAPLGDRSGSPQTGDVASSDVLERDQITLKASNMEELLANRFPGVIIRKAGGQAWIEIRGPGSISASTEALIVVDGVENSSRGLLAMNPEDVQRIEVLKGASAAMYGIRAANGVLVVTTRRQGE